MGFCTAELPYLIYFTKIYYTKLYYANRAQVSGLIGRFLEPPSGFEGAEDPFRAHLCRGGVVNGGRQAWSWRFIEESPFEAHLRVNGGVHGGVNGGVKVNVWDGVVGGSRAATRRLAQRQRCTL